MTRQHFQAFADEIRSRLDKETITIREAKYIAHLIANVCRPFNRHFKHDTFYKACGLVEDMR